MRWKDRRQSENIDDRRTLAPARGKLVAGGGLGLLLVVVIGLVTGVDPLALLQDVSASYGGTQPGAGTGTLSAEDQEAGRFIATILADTEDVWNELLPAAAQRAYQEPTLVLFRGAVQSACGLQDAAVGPFYCPGDAQVYIDLDFFDTLARQLDAPGDFAQAYVLAHEVGHHVQNLLGISDSVQARGRGFGGARANELSVRLELQADFLAGVWAHHAQRTTSFLEAGDLEEALNAASQIGDDTLQRETQGRVMPESFTHGTSEQRVRWFRLGFETGDLARMDTFAVPESQL
jgi:predicted metalloprotease